MAQARGLDLLVFPELSLVGHYGAECLRDVTMKRDDARLIELSRVAGDTILIVCFVEEGPGAQFHNASGVQRNVKLIYLRRKINLPSYG